MDWVIIARGAKPRGIRGELLTEGFGQPESRFQDLRQVWLRKGERDPQGPFTVDSVTMYRGGWIFHFAELPDRTAVEPWAGAEIVVPAGERPPLADGELYLADLLGASVIDRNTGETLGVVDSWQDYGGPPVFVVGKIEIPLARSICVEIDVAGKRIVVDLPEGLKDLNA